MKYKTTEGSSPFSDDNWGGRRLISELQAKARSVLDPLIPDASTVAFLDYPNNPNVGDSLIWLGEITYLRSRHVVINYTCDVRNYSRQRLAATLDDDAIILLQGGGNFGTLWPEEQQFRLRVLRDFPGTKIVQFAQSIHFADPLAVEETAQAIRAHGNYTLLVRDQPSFEFASDHFECSVIMCPDMAFFIGPIDSSPKSLFDRFILARTDHEQSSDWLAGLSDVRKGLSVDVSDWLQADYYERLLGRIERHTSVFRRLFDPHNKLLFVLWNHLARQRLKRGKRLLERGRVVISDRLHVHVLATLLNKPHAVLDNANRKVSSLHQAWTKPFNGVIFIDDLKGAFDAAERLDSLAGPDA